MAEGVAYEPRQEFLSFHNRTSRYACLVAHRRAGKTVACVADLIITILFKVKLEKPKAVYICPLYNQAKRVAWDYLKDMAKGLPDYKPNESELRVTFSTGKYGTATIQLGGSDRPDSYRGEYFDYVIMDEYAQIKPSLMGEVVRPAIADRKGKITILGTPKGHNAFYDTYMSAKDDPSWFCKMLKVSQTKLVDEEELEESRKIMTADEYAQEFECSFEAAIKGAIYAEDLKNAEITRVPHDPALQVSTYWDLGVSDSTSIIFTQDYGREIRIIDYYEATGEGLPHYASVLEAKKYNYKSHHAPHDISVRELGTGKSRIETAQSLGIRFQVVPNIPIHDGIQAARLLFSRCVIDENKCRPLIEALQNYVWDYNEKLGEFKSRPLHNWASHASDCFRYLAVGHKDIPKRDTQRRRPVAGGWMG